MSETAKTENAEKTRSLSLARHDAMGALEEARSSLVAADREWQQFLLEQRGSVLPLAGRAFGQTMLTPDGWRRTTRPIDLTPGEYVVGQNWENGREGWAVQLAHAGVEDSHWFEALIRNIHFAEEAEITASMQAMGRTLVRPVV